MMNFFKSRNVKNNAINHRIAKQIWAEIGRLHNGLNKDLSAYMLGSPRGVQLAEHHGKDGKVFTSASWTVLTVCLLILCED